MRLHTSPGIMQHRRLPTMRKAIPTMGSVRSVPSAPMMSSRETAVSAAIQIRLMDDLVASGVSGIMVSAVDPKTESEALNRIGSQVALATTDSDAPQTSRIAYIGSSNVDAGKQAEAVGERP